MEGALKQSDGLVRLFEQNTVDILERFDRTLLLLRKSFEDDPTHFDLRSWAARARLVSDETLQLALIGADGFLVSSTSDYLGSPVYVGDRAHFLQQREPGRDKLFISEPYRGRSSGQISIKLSRRVRGFDGGFGGVIVISIDPNFIERFYRTVDLGEKGSITLRNLDGVILAAQGFSGDAIGRQVKQQSFLDALSRSRSGYYWGGGAVDSTSRLVTYRTSETFPLIFTIGLAESDVLSGYYEHRKAYRSAAVIITTIILVAMIFTIRHQMMIDGGQDALKQLNEEISTQNVRFDAAIANMSNGLSMFDADGKLMVWNDRYIEIYGMSHALIQRGVSINTIVEHRKQADNLDLDVEAYVDEFRKTLIDAGRSTSISRLKNGQQISVVNTAIAGGGWVGVHEDITQRTQSETALLKSKTLLSSTLTALSDGVVVQDASGRIISCNPAAERILGGSQDELSGVTPSDTNWQAIREDGRDFPGKEHPSEVALATGKPQIQIVMGLRRSDGSVKWLSINSVPIYAEGNTEPESIVTSFSDITARKLAQEVLTEAISAIPDGFVIYDNNDRLVACNEAYKEIYAASAAAIKPGITFPELLRYGIDHSQYPEAGETRQQQSKWLTERIERHRASNANIVQELPNGRWLQIRERLTPSGYIVGFRTDVTELKRETGKLQAVIDNFPGGISFLDADLNIVASNPTFRTLLDLPEALFQKGHPSLETIIRANVVRGEYGPGDPDEQVRLRMELARKGRAHLFERTRPDGTVLEVRGTPIKGGGFITTYMDITTRHAAEKRLSDSERRAQEKSATLQLTLAHMSQGLSMFDANGQLMVWNDRYAEIYGVSPDLLKQGVSVNAISEHLSQTGYVETDEPDWRQKLAENDSFASTLRFSDGRVIRIVRTPIEGSGWVATHEDITEQMRAEASLFQQSAELARINMHFDAALSNMAQGLCMFDGQKRMVVWNDRYAKLYQIPPDLLKVGTPHDEIITDRIFRGILKGETNESVAKAKIDALGQLPKDATSSRVDEFADGRLMLVTRQPMADGGWLATHEDITEQRRAEAEIVHLARHDVLTGLANRAEFNEKLEEASKRLKRSGGAVTVMMLDLDKFKAVNDTLGHPAGDQLLVEVGRRLQSTIRETDVLARLGGDEFAIIQEGGPNQHEGAIALALRIIGAITQPFDLDGHQANVGTSIGIVLAPEHGVDPEELLKKADLALYDAKAGGRNDFRIFQSEMLEVVKTQESAESELRDALAHDEFEIYYQPVIDAKSRQLCGAEALVRWRHPTKGLIEPEQFISLAESTGLIVSLGEWILQQACTHAASWPKHIKVAINISALQFKKGNLFDVILCTLVETGLSPERLELEITETALLERHEANLTTIRQLKNLGISIALDDFGTGYSSMNYLTIFPFDKIKIDKSFTQGVLNRRDCKAVVASTLALAHGLGTVTTAEGVETEEQLEYLRDAGVDFLQGYLFGQPVPIDQLDLHGAAPSNEMVA